MASDDDLGPASELDEALEQLVIAREMRMAGMGVSDNISVVRDCCDRYLEAADE